jgi:hypothetical protein
VILFYYVFDQITEKSMNQLVRDTTYTKSELSATPLIVIGRVWDAAGAVKSHADAGSGDSDNTEQALALSEKKQ